MTRLIDRPRIEARRLRNLRRLSRVENSSPTPGPLLRRGRNGSHPAVRAGVILVAVVVVVAGATTALRGGRYFSHEHKSGLVAEAVRRGPLEIKLTERGNVESGDNLTLRCMVEGGAGTSILKLVNEGEWVEKDQVLVELDSSLLRSDALLQKIRLQTAEAALKTAEANVAIQKMQNDSDVAATELKLKLARLDLRNYKNGDFLQESHIVEGEIAIAQEYFVRAQERQKFTEQLLRRGFTTSKLLDADRVAIARARIDLESAREKKQVLDEFTHKRDLAEMESNVAFYERELGRVKLRAEASLVQRGRNLLAAKRTHFLENERYKKLERQIAACTIRTPRAGMVVYANPADGNRASTGPPIYEGAVVRERQALIQLPDLSDMQVKARIHESKIAMVQDGLSATIHVDAFAGETFHGFVDNVALVPMSANFPNPNLKEYATVVRITDEAGTSCTLKPGMTAEIEILAERLDSVLQIPIHSCVERGGRYFAWVLDDEDELTRREVKVGKSNDAATEILEGLAEGEEVVCNPRSALAEEIALLEEEIGANTDSPFEVPFPAPAIRPEPVRQPRKGDSARPPDSPGSAPGHSVAAVSARTEEKTQESESTSGSIALFSRLDENGDAKVTEKELRDEMQRMLRVLDTNGDKVIDKDEWKNAARIWPQPAERRCQPGGGQ